MNIEKFLIICTGQGDTDIILANGAAKEWIESEPPPEAGSGWMEALPPAVLEGHEVEGMDLEVYITCGSFDNDRALQCPGERFETITKAMEQIQAKGYKLIGEFHGMIY